MWDPGRGAVSGYQAWQQAPFPTEPSRWPLLEGTEPGGCCLSQPQSLSRRWTSGAPCGGAVVSVYVVPAGAAVKCPLAQRGSEILVPSQNLQTGDGEDWLSWKPRLPWAPRGSSGNGSESDHCLQVRERWLKAVISLRLINGCREAAHSSFLGKIGLGKGMSQENGNGLGGSQSSDPRGTQN